MRTDFSEFSFGYALTAELAGKLHARNLGPPQFLSTRAEGKEGGGWDMKLGLLFLQFKIPYVMKRRIGVAKRLTPPLYRMHLQPRSGWRQHQLLLRLEAKQPWVRYTSPRFDTNVEFAAAYRSGVVAGRSIFVPPRLLPIPTDQKRHYVAYDQSTPLSFFCGDPIELTEPVDGDSFLKQIEEAMRGLPDRPSEDVLPEVLTEMKIVIQTVGEELSPRLPPRRLRKWRDLEYRPFELLERSDRVFEEIASLSAVEQIRFLALTYFDAVPLLI